MKIFFRALLSLIAIAICLPAQGQLSRANKDFEMGAFNLAVRGYLELLEKRPADYDAMLMLADSYRHLNQMEEARSWYVRVLSDRDGRKLMVGEHRFNYALVLMALEQYDKAKQEFEAYAASSGKPAGNNAVDENSEAKGRQFAQSCTFAMNQLGQSSSYLVSNEYINTTSSDFGPAFYGDQVVFSSARTDLRPAGSTWTGKANNQLFMARVGSNGFLEAPAPLQSQMQDDETFVNAGPVSYGPDNKTVAFTRNNFIDGTRHIPNGGLELSLQIAQINSSGDWAEQKPFPYNGSGFSTGWPNLSPDGNALYFASNRPDGFGGFDLYVSYRMGNTWSTPENLGRNVNTPGDEVSPFFDGNYLYFSSNWHQGLGGYDIFRAEQANGRWARIFHLGNLINSSRDDYGFVYDSFRNIGYMVSNRPGGRGNEDIYKVFKSADNIVFNIRNASDGTPVPEATIDFINCGEGLFKADSRGVYSFQAVEGLDCNIVIRADGYNDAVFSVATMGVRQNRAYDIMLSRRGEEYIGKIMNYSTRLPVAGVAVSATNQSTNSTMQASTDVNGDYALALSPNTSYIVRYSRPGFRDISRTVNTGEGNNRAILGEISMLAISGAADSYPGSDVAPRPGGLVNEGGAISASGEGVALGSGYAVQIASLKSPGLESYSGLSNIGQVYSKYEGGAYKVRIGVFGSRSEASSALNAAKARGYKDAFIIAEEGSNSAQPKGNQGTAGTPSSSTGGRYKVQLGAFKNPQNFNSSGLERYGNIEDRPRGGLTLKLLAGFDDIEEAKQAWSRAKAAGFTTAFIVLDTGSELTKVYP